MSEEKTKEEIQKELQEKFKDGVDISAFGFGRPVTSTPINAEDIDPPVKE